MKAALAVAAAIFYAASMDMLTELEPIYSAHINIGDSRILTPNEEFQDSIAEVDPRSIVLRIGVPSYTRLNLQGQHHKDHEYYNDIFRIESHCDRHGTLADSTKCAAVAKELNKKLPYYKSEPKAGRTTRKFLLNGSQLWNGFLRIVNLALLVVIAICALNQRGQGERQLTTYALAGLTFQLISYLSAIYLINSKLASYLDFLRGNLVTYFQEDSDLTVMTAESSSFKTLAALGLFGHAVVMLLAAGYLYMLSSEKITGSDFTVINDDQLPPLSTSRSFFEEDDRQETQQRVIPIDGN